MGNVPRFPMTIRHMKYVRAALVASAGALLIAVGVWAWRAYHYPQGLVQCMRNMAEIRRALIWETDAWPRDDQGNVLWPEKLPPVEEHLLTCPTCGEPYVFSATAPSGDRIRRDDSRRFVLWCPRPCHAGQRVFLLGDMGVRACREEGVDWHCQRVP